MNTLKIRENNEVFNSERMDFLKWSTNWINKDKLDENVVFHIFEIGTILQILGFKVIHFEKQKNFSKNYGPKIETNIQIDITCSNSGIRTVFEKTDHACHCPNFNENSEEIKYINGLRSDQLSNHLFPNLKHKSKLLLGLFHNVHNLIKDEIRSNAQIICDKSESLNNNREPAEGARGWEVDPRTTPPTGTSSPLSNILTTINLFGSAEEREMLLGELLDGIRSSMDILQQTISAHRRRRTNRDAPAKVKPEGPAPESSLKSYEREPRTPQQAGGKPAGVLSMVKENVLADLNRVGRDSTYSSSPKASGSRVRKPPLAMRNLNTNNCTPNRFKQRNPAKLTDKTGATRLNAKNAKNANLQRNN